MTEEEKDTKTYTLLIAGCMLHIAVGMVAAGVGYYLGWGIGLLIFGCFVGLWSLVVWVKMKKELRDANNDSA